MSVVIVSYPPAAGGNHFKNILCLSNHFANSAELDSTVYNQAIDKQGTVHCIHGRNVQPWLVERATNNPEQCWIIPGHLGELAPYRTKLLEQSRKFISISIDTSRERRILGERQNRLGQQNHPYWLEEEQPFFYQSLMYETYFNTAKEDILVIPLSHFWHPTFQEGLVLDQVENFLSVKIERFPANILHTKWLQANMLI